MSTWKCKVKLSGGGIQEVTVQADNFQNAKDMLEATYGKGNVIGGPIKVYQK